MNWKKLFLAIFVITVSCQGETKTPNFPSGIPSDIPSGVNFDDGIELRVLAINTDMPFGIIINLLVLNKSNSEIWFPKDFDVAMYQQTNFGEWLSVPNLVNYYPVDTKDGFFIEPYRDISTAGSFAVSPSVLDENLELPLRIFVVGHTVSSDRVTDELVGAHVDVMLSK